MTAVGAGSDRPDPAPTALRRRPRSATRLGTEVLVELLVRRLARPLHRGPAPAGHPDDLGAPHHRVLPAPRRSRVTRCRAAVGGKLSEEALDTRRAALGLDRPLIVQYLEYLGDVARLDFGATISDNRPVLDIIRDQGGATLTLTLGAFLFALIIGIPLGRIGWPPPRHRGGRRHPGLRRRQLRRADLLGRHHARAAGGEARSPAGRPTTSPACSTKFTDRAAGPTSSFSTRSWPATATPSRTCSSTTCCRASRSACCCPA